MTEKPPESPVTVCKNGKCMCMKHRQHLFYVYLDDGEPKFVCQVCEDEFYSKKVEVKRNEK